MRRLLSTAVVVASIAAVFAGERSEASREPMPRPQEVLSLTGDVSGVHDPAVIKEGNTYYLFSTGGRSGEGIIPIRTSTDL